MNARILDLIKNPEILKAEDLSLLVPEIERLTYMQSLRAIYLLGIHKFQNADFQQELTKTAAYTTDKKILYHFINEKKKTTPISEIITENTDNKKIKTEISAENLSNNANKKISTGIDFYTKHQPKTEVKSVKTQESSTFTPSYAPKNSIMDFYTRAQSLQNHRTESENITHSQPIDFYQKPIHIEENKEQEVEIPQEETSVETPQWQPMSIENFSPSVPQTIVEEKIEEEIIIEEKEFSLALEIEETTENIIQTPEQEEEIPPQEKNIVQSNVPQFINTWQNWLNATPPPSERDKKLAIIDKFIENNPKMPPANEEVEFVVKEKSDDISHLMTETLAQLYLEQKLYSKAINAYKILQEKYPEREEEFAETIEEIKKSRNK